MLSPGIQNVASYHNLRNVMNIFVFPCHSALRVVGQESEPSQATDRALALLSPALRHSNLRRQVPPRLHDARDSSSEGGNYGREYLAEMTTSTPFWDLLHATKYDMGPTALLPPPKEGVLRNFSS